MYIDKVIHMSNKTKSLHVRIDEELYNRLWSFIKEKSGSTYGQLRRAIEEAIRLYLNQTETARETEKQETRKIEMASRKQREYINILIERIAKRLGMSIEETKVMLKNKFNIDTDKKDMTKTEARDIIYNLLDIDTSIASTKQKQKHKSTNITPHDILDVIE